MKIEGVIFKEGEIPKKLFKVVSGTVRETRNKTYHDLKAGDYIALLEYFTGLPLEEDIVAIDESEIVDVSWEEEYTDIIKKTVELRRIMYQTSIDVENIVLEDFEFENVDLDEYLDQIEALLTLSAGELPDDKNEAMKMIQQLEDDKLITKVNLVRRFLEKFPQETVGARLLIETAAKVYIILNDKFLAKALLKKVLLYFPRELEYCYEALKALEGIYKDEGNILWRRFNKTSKVIEVMMRGNS
ncbi:MAG: cyclic nucleotide-binding domain-containing protein [Fervidobacterium sp.]|nr:cyclic nucleotide-binding domain-containing protein [Fervidobacterium sp.]